MIANLRPGNLGLLDCVVEECDERFSAEQQDEIVRVVGDVLGREGEEGEGDVNGGESNGVNGDGVNGDGVNGSGINGVNGDGAHEGEREEDGLS